jgi:hypothetical protein
VCFNCRLVWDLRDPQFTPRELERLSIYRAAVRAGFYSDYLA